MDNFVVWAADVGSISSGRFGWCRASLGIRDIEGMGTDIQAFVRGIADDLAESGQVALGFECPLFVPIRDDPLELTCARLGEGNRPFSAGAGSCSLVTGLVEYTWVFQRLRHLSQVSIQPTFEWTSFVSQSANLFIWEAFVSRQNKRDEIVAHIEDAETAAHTFLRSYPDIEQANAVTAQTPFSLIGASLLRSGLTNDLSFLHESCIVIRG